LQNWGHFELLIIIKNAWDRFWLEEVGVFGKPRFECSGFALENRVGKVIGNVSFLPGGELIVIATELGLRCLVEDLRGEDVTSHFEH
jgi:hypothetical protein